MSRRMLGLLTAVLVAGMIAVVWGAKAPEKKTRERGHQHEHGEQGHRHDHEDHGHKEGTRETKEEHKHGKQDEHGHATTTRKSTSSA